MNHRPLPDDLLMMDFLNVPVDELRAYAENWEDQEYGEDPARLAWVFVPAFPLAALRFSPTEWAEWFAQENALADVPGYLDGLLGAMGNEPIDPLVIGLVSEPHECVVNIWDGSHRVGAAHTKGVTHLPVVLGLPPELTWAHVPSPLRADLPTQAALATVLGQPPFTPVRAPRHARRHR